MPIVMMLLKKNNTLHYMPLNVHIRNLIQPLNPAYFLRTKPFLEDQQTHSPVQKTTKKNYSGIVMSLIHAF